jgi:hypothetical protein
MSRPVKARTVKSYGRDVETLGRLRTALVLDSSVNQDVRARAIQHIDGLIEELSVLMVAAETG